MKKIFKIAMVAACPFPYPRGTPVRIFRMAEALTQRGHEVHVITYHLGNEINGALFKVHRIKDIKTYHKYSPGPTYQKVIVIDPLLAVKLYKFLKHNEVDIIHAHNYEGLLISLFLSKNVRKPVIYDAHTLLESELPYYRLGLSKKILKLIGSRIDTWLPIKADHIITVTDTIRIKLIQKALVVPENITTIMNGVEKEHFILRNEYQNHMKTLIFTGNLAPYQGIDLLLKAFQLVLNRRSDIKLNIITESPFDCYEPLANELNIRNSINIFRSDFNMLPKYLAESDIALNPRVDCDGIPQKLINYMAAGKPIVSFESSGKSLLDGQKGLIVEDRNIPAFADAILKLLNDTVFANTLGDNARKFINSKCNWENTALLTETVYEKVLSGNHKNKKYSEVALI
jgi:glycosyltransferase involved in cell wall biosynthesis